MLAGALSGSGSELVDDDAATDSTVATAGATAAAGSTASLSSWSCAIGRLHLGHE